MGNAVSTQLTTPNKLRHRRQSPVADRQACSHLRHLHPVAADQQRKTLLPSPAFLPLTYNANSTASFSGANINTGTAAAPSGYAYASYLLGAVGGTPSIGLQPISELGGRYRPIAPYVEDSFKSVAEIDPRPRSALGLPPALSRSQQSLGPS